MNIINLVMDGRVWWVLSIVVFILVIWFVYKIGIKKHTKSSKGDKQK